MEVNEARHLDHVEQEMRLAEMGYALPIVGDRFFDSILKFNLFPALYAHPEQISSLDVLPAAVLQDDMLQDETLLTASGNDWNPYWLRCLSDALLRSSRLEPHYDFDFSAREKRLMLLDASALIQLGRHVAAILLQPYLRKVVLGERVREIEQVMGAACREFGLRWVAGQDVALVQVAAALQGLGDAGIEALGTEEDWHQFVFRLILSALSESDIAVRGRLKLKFSPALQQVKSFRLQEGKRNLLVTLFFDVLNKTFPAWHDQVAIELPGELHARTDSA
ncbi:YOP protein translocation protein K (YscK) [Collimonas sp. PA-H2]|uniref:SctK family type III secretion system sorting platform protein n=1 Tax=Collimonas sp. PA-H2 TaxID=1881062 RepID=UPI000BF76A93|nr:SctK family type III secretion system sorting platform protein [Collimonas sp. PA-H2]PFH08652.1 YOP protein translocation protein K (YscK) [Collimonas sp. PA-H2]